MLFEGDAKEELGLLNLLVVLWVWHVGDVTKFVGEGCHVVRCLREMLCVGSPCVVVNFALDGVHVGTCTAHPLVLHLFLLQL